MLITVRFLHPIFLLNNNNDNVKREKKINSHNLSELDFEQNIIYLCFVFLHLFALTRQQLQKKLSHNLKFVFEMNSKRSMFRLGSPTTNPLVYRKTFPK